MPLYKSAQTMEDSVMSNDSLYAKDKDDHEEDMIQLDEEDYEPGTDVILYEDKPSEEEVLEMHEEDVDSECAEEPVHFHLENIPGAPDDAQVIMTVTESHPGETSEVTHKKNDPWDWQSCGLEGFFKWFNEKLSCVPKHSGRHAAGLHRASNYLKKLRNEAYKAVQSDYDGKLDISKAEEAINACDDGIVRLEKRLSEVEGKKRAFNQEEGLVKQAKAPSVHGIIITVPLLISRVARVCINGTVSAGHDIEDLFDRQVKKYSLDKSQQAEVMQLLADMGYPMRRDRGYDIDEDLTVTDGGDDFAANYYS